MGKAVTALLILLLAGCTPPATSGFCDVARPIYPNAAAWAAADRQFKLDLVAHNETGERLCRWKRLR